MYIFPVSEIFSLGLRDMSLSDYWKPPSSLAILGFPMGSPRSREGEVVQKSNFFLPNLRKFHVHGAPLKTTTILHHLIQQIWMFFFNKYTVGVGLQAVDCSQRRPNRSHWPTLDVAGPPADRRGAVAACWRTGSACCSRQRRPLRPPTRSTTPHRAMLKTK